MKCKICGNDVKKDDKFCTKCGTSIPENSEGNECYFGNRTNKEFLDDVTKYLEQGEIFEAIFRGQTGEKPGKGLFVPKGIYEFYLILTNKRIMVNKGLHMLLMKGLHHPSIEFIDYKEITNLAHHKGLAYGSIAFHIRSVGERKFDRLLNRDAEMAAVMLADKIKEYKNDISQQKQIQTDEDPIVILKKRLAKGEINKTEYDELRSILEK